MNSRIRVQVIRSQAAVWLLFAECILEEVTAWLDLASDIFTESQLYILGTGGQVSNDNSQLEEIRFTLTPNNTDGSPMAVHELKLNVKNGLVKLRYVSNGGEESEEVGIIIQAAKLENVPSDMHPANIQINMHTCAV